MRSTTPQPGQAWSRRRARSMSPLGGHAIGTGSNSSGSGAEFGHMGSATEAGGRGEDGQRSSERMLQLMVLVPVLVGAPRRSEEEVANIGTTWTHGSSKEDVPCIPAAQQTVAWCESQDPAAKHDACGICLEPFQHGEKLTALPCTTGGCPSVWHADCIRKWLCQGQTQTCPLCRWSVDPGGNSPAPSVTFALEVRAALPLDGAGRRASSRLAQDLVQELLLLALVPATRGMAGLDANAPGGLGANANNYLLAALEQLAPQVRAGVHPPPWRRSRRMPPPRHGGWWGPRYRRAPTPQMGLSNPWRSVRHALPHSHLEVFNSIPGNVQDRSHHGAPRSAQHHRDEWFAVDDHRHAWGPTNVPGNGVVPGFDNSAFHNNGYAQQPRTLRDGFNVLSATVVDQGQVHWGPQAMSQGLGSLPEEGSPWGGSPWGPFEGNVAGSMNVGLHAAGAAVWPTTHMVDQGMGMDSLSEQSPEDHHQAHLAAIAAQSAGMLGASAWDAAPLQSPVSPLPPPPPPPPPMSVHPHMGQPSSSSSAFRGFTPAARPFSPHSDQAGNNWGLVSDWHFNHERGNLPRNSNTRNAAMRSAWRWQ